MRKVRSCLIIAAVLTAPLAAGCKSAQPNGDTPPPINIERKVAGYLPSPPPLWYENFDAWLRQNPAMRGKAFIAGGDGPSDSEARRRAREEAAKSHNIPIDELHRLKFLGQFLMWYDDGSYTVALLCEYSKPRAAESLDEGARKICGELLERIPPARKAAVKTVAVGSFHYKDTRSCAEFSELLRSAMLAALQAKLGEAAMGRESLLRKLDGDAAAVWAVIDPDDTEARDNPPADALITGRFWPADDDQSVLVQASIKELATGALLGGASASISTKGIAVEIAPEKIEAAQKNIAAVNELRENIRPAAGGKKNFKIQLWPKDARQVWKAGEKFAVHFRSERDCYLNILHVDTNGKVQLLFPNQWHDDAFVRGGRDYTIPGPAMDFDWDIVPPFGVETIMAVATATKTPGLFEFRPGKDVAFRSIGDVKTRGIEIVAKQMTASMAKLAADQKAEKVITITTVGEKEHHAP